MIFKGGLPEWRPYGNSLLSVTPEEISKFDLSDKSSLTGVVIAVPATCISLITVIVSLRLLLRRHTIGRLLVDDYLIVLASVFTIVVCSSVLAASQYGLGKHIWNLDFVTIIPHLKRCIRFMFVANVFYALAICFTKLSIVSSYVYIFDPHGRLKVLMYGTATVSTGLGIAALPATIFECLPVHAAWDVTYVGAKCYTFVDFLYASTAISVVTDIMLCVIPIPLLWRLQLPLRQKLLISTRSTSHVRCPLFIRTPHFTPADPTDDLVSSVMWTIAECTIGIVCVSLPPLRLLIVRVMPDLFHLHSSQSSRPTEEQLPRDQSLSSSRMRRLKFSRLGRSDRSDRSAHRQWSQKTVDVVMLSSVSSQPSQLPQPSWMPRTPPNNAFILPRHQSLGIGDIGMSVMISAGPDTYHDRGWDRDRARSTTLATTATDSTLVGSPKVSSMLTTADGKARQSLGSLHDSEVPLSLG
ncbi:plasma membrane protein [Grosmannia clavigera kw1407]|uniref:Plasma membrane protein n=1 Tax=Grosmannia clavigera (strain kw1407 / UAMH 11150) TaxID=655863 RepID=F0X849_GROCL|nr:plasma membrane protein [Grosmannia clavigera kw1407]EFX05459.1 plasma membrane protein [Grosmannia clavigera kw1407]